MNLVSLTMPAALPQTREPLSFWPFRSLRERIQSLWDQNLAQKPNLRDHLNEIRKKADQHQAPPKTSQISDWKVETDRQLGESIRIIALAQTLEWMHPRLAETEPNRAAQIIRETANSNRTLCDVYLEKKGHELSLLSVWIVRLTYFFLYECGIIPNIVDSSSKAILEHIRLGLVQKNGGKNLTVLTSIILKRLNSFLSDYLKAVTEFGQGMGTGSKEEYVKEQLKKDLDPICQEFGDLIANDFLPHHISFFQGWKDSPHLGVRLLTKLCTYYPELWLTSFVHAQLREKIPAQMKSLIQTKTEKADERRDLSFSIAITQGIIEQLGKFEQKLNDREISTALPRHIAGTEDLPVVISLLLDVLRLESCKKRTAIKEELDKKSTVSSRIRKSLEESLIDGCRTFFSFLSDPNHSEEFLSTLLLQATTPFTSDAPSTDQEWDNQKKDYQELQEKMREKAGEIFRAITRESIVQRLQQGLPDSAQEAIAQAFCARERERWNTTAGQFLMTVQSMQKKVGEIPADPKGTPLPSLEKSILDELDLLVKQVSSCRSSILSSLEEMSQELPNSLKNGIEEALDPLVFRLDALLNSKNGAKNLQEQLTSESIAATTLQMLQNSLRERATVEKLEEFSKLWPLFEQALFQLRSVKKETHVAANCLKGLQESHRQLQVETLLVRNLESLMDSKEKGKGLLSQFAKAIYANLKEPSFIFSPRKLRAQIAILCQSLPEGEREEILSIVDAMRNAESVEILLASWNRLQVQVPALWGSHIAQKQRSLKTLKQTLSQAESWVQEQLDCAEGAARASKQALSDVLSTMETVILPQLSEEIEKILPNRKETYWDQGKRILKNHTSTVISTAGFGIGGVLTYFEVGAWTLPVAGLLAGVVQYMMSDPNKPAATKPKTEANAPAADIQNQVITKALISAGAGALLGGGAAAWIPSYAEWITPFVLWYAGKNAHQAVTIGGADNIVFPQVQEVFDDLYQFILQPHVWNRLAIEAIDAINVANRKG